MGTVGFVCPSSFWIAAQILNSSIPKKILCDFQKHKKYTKIIDKNRLKMDSLQSRFSWIFLMKTSPDLSCIWKPLKWAFQNWSYMPKKSICFIKVCQWKLKIWLFLNGNNQIFVFHRQTLIKHKSLKILTFWTCKTSFEKLISRALRFCKNIGGVR